LTRPFPQYGEPRPADIVCCIDVIEHIEMEYLDAVLLDLKEITREVGFFSVHTGPAVKSLPDGRNAHLIQQPSSWWFPNLCQAFRDQPPAGAGKRILGPDQAATHLLSGPVCLSVVNDMGKTAVGIFKTDELSPHNGHNRMTDSYLLNI
jgi:hypothetical protein